MTNSAPDSRNVPIWKDVDLLVLGATSAAVAAAVTAAGAGRRVALVADELYLGQDLAGSLRLWAREAGREDPLLTTAYAASGSDPARPAALKRSLESALLQAGVELLYGGRPIGLLRSESGTLHGAVIVVRSSLLAVKCHSIIDATPSGLATRLAGIPILNRPAAESATRWRILADRRPGQWSGPCEEITPGYVHQLEDGPKTYAAFELGFAPGELGNDPRAAEHEARAALVDESVWVTADSLIQESREVVASASLASSVDSISDEMLMPGPGLWLANGLVPVADPSLANRPGEMVALGRRVGRLASAQLPSVSSKSGGALHLVTGGPVAHVTGFSETFLRDGADSIEVREWMFPEWDPVDVIVAGGGTAGAPAAVAAAREGVRTLCLETAHGLGGVGTIGLIASYWFGNKVGFTNELTGLMAEVDSLSRSKKGNQWHPLVKSCLYHRLLRDAGGTAWLGSFACGVRRNGNRPDGVLVSTPFGCGFVRAKSFIDGTGNSDLAAAAGAECRLMGERHAAVQGAGISPRVYPSVQAHNSDHTFIEDNDPVGVTSVHVQARAKFQNGFDTMPFVNSRERRQIVGDLEMSPLDILAGRTFPDTIFTAKSNFDTHGFIVHPVFMVVPPNRSTLTAHVPLRCMIPKGIEGVLVTGLGMSAHRDAFPVIRMQADLQNQGYATGLLAARVARSGENFRDLDIKAFQQELVSRGIISDETAAHEDSFPLPASAIEAAASGDLNDVKDVGILFAHPEEARRHLLPILENGESDERRETAALILGLMGAREAAVYIHGRLETATWDEGWNYRGIGQFGPSMSRLDAMIIALGRCGSADMADPLIRLAGELGDDPTFSHCRALALATATLKSPALTAALAALLDLPGVRGHAFRTMEELLTDADADPFSNGPRNRALREIYMARGLYLAGDVDGSGREVLERYSMDLRGHFVRHATSVLRADTSQSTCALDLA